MLPGVIGALQAAECVKWILGQGDLLAGRLLLYDALKARFREIAVARDPRCPVCGDSPSIRELLDYEEFCGICEDEQPTGGIPRLEADELKKLLDRRADVCLLDVRQPFEASIASIPGSLNIPLDDLSRRLHELDRERQRRIVVYCRDGRRSQRAAEMLSRAGFADVAVAHGGLIAWSVRVDPRMPRY
ncbi:MAG: putative adenylyltransferase/sulfurtransferase MoeZ [candidate division BRC1 bacterium ADurb.BinA364]|nr:MAG: putative adenylyltransferase/sulfurtransferase MoeZ [candidate division BRC1 bacterium ADurb.BinA364]